MTVRDLPSAAAGAAFAALGVAALIGAFAMREGPGYAAVGPRVMPVLVSAGLLVSGLAMLLVALRTAPSAAEPVDRTALGLSAAAFAVYLGVFFYAGFLIATALYLPAQARIFGSRRPVRDVVCGAVLALGAYLLFEGLLGLQLPYGPIEALIDPIVPRFGR